jgi:hypothetical protein
MNRTKEKAEGITDILIKSNPSVLHGGAEFTRLEVELMTDATLGAAVVDDLFGIRSVAPTSRFPYTDVGIVDR